MNQVTGSEGESPHCEWHVCYLWVGGADPGGGGASTLTVSLWTCRCQAVKSDLA